MGFSSHGDAPCAKIGFDLQGEQFGVGPVSAVFFVLLGVGCREVGENQRDG
jgi:hypothetical protein